MRSITVSILALAAFAAGCSVTGEPIEFSKACALENDGKTFEVSGVLAQRGSVFCSNTGGRMECGFDLLESAGSANRFASISNREAARTRSTSLVADTRKKI